MVGEPNHEHIAELERQIADNEALLPQYQGEKWVEETVQTDLFSEPEIIRVDKNKAIRTQLTNTINNCKKEIERELNKCTPQGFEAAVLQVTDWNPYDQNTVSPFLDMEWMFGVTEGFDIVIGNPPYIQLQADKGKLAKLYENCGYNTFSKGGDIFCLFYERGWQLIKRESNLCFITSNKWMRTGYGENLREFLTRQTTTNSLIDFGGYQVFESANIDTCIVLFSKHTSQKAIASVRIKNDFTRKTDIHKYLKENGILCKFIGSETWIIVPDNVRNIKKKIESQGLTLKDWNVEIYRGILTGYDKAFVITTEQRNSILQDCSNLEEKNRTELLIQPILRGRNIKKYRYEWNDLWLIATFPSRKYDIKDYPSVERFFLSFTKEKLEQTGKKYLINGETIKARKKTNNNWFEIQDSIKYWKEFSKPKIIYPNMTKYLPFVYDETGILTNPKCYILTGTHIAYLTAFFNSSLFKFCFRDNFPTLGEDRRELQKIHFDKIPVMEVDDATDAEFRELVLDIQKEYSDEKAKAIDQKIFDLYGLTQEECDMIGYIDYHNNNEEDNDE